MAEWRQNWNCLNYALRPPGKIRLALTKTGVGASELLRQ